jgi:XTP/dITP diphosphohydrolase
MGQKKMKSFDRLLKIMDELRAKCPWDKEQTFESLRNLTIEEAYELSDSVMKKDITEMKKELGDLMLHIIFYAKIASEMEVFDIHDVIESLCEKLIFRHPHIFGDVDVKGSSENVKKNWEELKQKEGNKEVLSGVPSLLPALIKANRVQEKVHAVGFDWDKKEQIWEKVREELYELEEEVKANNQTKIEEEFGDLLFSIVNAARLYNIDPETALEKTNRKFIKRFTYLEHKTIGKGLSLKTMSLDEMNVIWEESKKFDGA